MINYYNTHDTSDKLNCNDGLNMPNAYYYYSQTLH